MYIYEATSEPKVKLAALKHVRNKAKCIIKHAEESEGRLLVAMLFSEPETLSGSSSSDDPLFMLKPSSVTIYFPF